MHKSPLTQWLAFFHPSHHDWCFSNQKFIAFLVNVFSSELRLSVCVLVCVWVHVLWAHSLCNCGGKRPQTAHTETHRLQSTIHLSHHPYLCFPFPPTKHLVGSLGLQSLHPCPLPSSSTTILSSIHLPPSHDLPQYHSLICLCQARTIRTSTAQLIHKKKKIHKANVFNSTVALNHTLHLGRIQDS